MDICTPFFFIYLRGGSWIGGCLSIFEAIPISCPFFSGCWVSQVNFCNLSLASDLLSVLTLILSASFLLSDRFLKSYQLSHFLIAGKGLVSNPGIGERSFVRNLVIILWQFPPLNPCLGLHIVNWTWGGDTAARVRTRRMWSGFLTRKEEGIMNVWGHFRWGIVVRVKNRQTTQASTLSSLCLGHAVCPSIVWRSN